LLPLYSAAFGVSLVEAGVLLAANRLIRIFAYGPVARLYARLGARATCTVAALAAILAALAYGVTSGFWPLLAARLLWGLSFATQNLANQALATGTREGATRRSGNARAIIASGSMTGLALGAAVAYLWGPREALLVLFVVSLLAPVFALRLPSTGEAIATGRTALSRPSAISIWGFAFGFVMDGVFVFGLALIAKASFEQAAVLAAGAVLGLRYASEMVLSPASGRIAERFGALAAMIALSLGLAVCLALLSATGLVLWSLVVIATVLRALVQPLAPPVVAELYPGPARVPALARQAIWRDVGAGAGPLASGALFTIFSPLLIWVGAGALLAAATLLLRYETKESDGVRPP
jgi:predicted MFS family arabinose efflux permease